MRATHAPQKIFRPSEIVSDAIFGVKEQELLHACLALKTYTLAKLGGVARHGKL